MIDKKTNFFIGFKVFFLLSIIFNLMFVSLFKKQAEYLASDLLHLIPTGLFNALLEVNFPMFPDILFLIPLGLTDGIIGGIVGLIFGLYLRNKTKGFIYICMVVSFGIFEFVDVKFIPIFTP